MDLIPFLSPPVILQASREHLLCVSLALLPGMLGREERRLEALGKGKRRSPRSCNSPAMTLGESFQRCSPPGLGSHWCDQDGDLPPAGWFGRIKVNAWTVPGARAEEQPVLRRCGPCPERLGVGLSRRADTTGSACPCKSASLLHLRQMRAWKLLGGNWPRAAALGGPFILPICKRSLNTNQVSHGRVFSLGGCCRAGRCGARGRFWEPGRRGPGLG